MAHPSSLRSVANQLSKLVRNTPDIAVIEVEVEWKAEQFGAQFTCDRELAAALVPRECRMLVERGAVPTTALDSAIRQASEQWFIDL